MKAAAVLLVVSALNSFVMLILGLALVLDGTLYPNILIDWGIFILGIVGLFAFYLTMVENMKIARASKAAEAKK